MIYSFRERERAAFEQRGRRMFWLGLLVPAIACAVVALVVGPDSWLGWAAVIATPFAASAGVAIVFMVQDRRKEPTT